MKIGSLCRNGSNWRLRRAAAGQREAAIVEQLGQLLFTLGRYGRACCWAGIALRLETVGTTVLPWSMVEQLSQLRFAQGVSCIAVRVSR